MKSCQLEKLKQVLPRTPGINHREEFFNSAVMVLLASFNGEYHFIFEKRCSQIRQGGEICFPGGRFDPSEDKEFLQTAIRETVEELGIPEEKIEIIGRLDNLVTPMGIIVEAFVGIADIKSLTELKTDPHEVEYAFSIPVSYFEGARPIKYRLPVKVHPAPICPGKQEIELFPAQELGLPERYLKPWGEMKYSVYVYQVGKEVIWGITARFVYDLVQKIVNNK